MKMEIEARISAKLDLLLKKMDERINRMDEEERRRSELEQRNRLDLRSLKALIDRSSPSLSSTSTSFDADFPPKPSPTTHVCLDTLQG
ncbi:hypothetical protein GUJ93_ZPchr0015g6996 [Zizania palustris]|uniref:Uncharacterized protein n=1 Tax=Zizania palustris TaxID=103762 RepID=A0A8J5VSR2_ZIZPA|nr:hypothetical protein GUJ93_ZPchr0015g6996 [Zizania palustris]